MDAAAPALVPADLAPGDAAAAAFDWTGLAVHRIRRADHPWFARAYQRLWEEFGPRGEMELRPVIEARLRWDPRRPIAGHGLRYELLAVERDGEIVALRDHTAIAPSSPAGAAGRIVVHLSHLLIEPPWRGRGLSGWMRAFPVRSAHECAAAVGEHAHPDVTLVAEMEPFDGVTPAITARLRSYGRAGFAMIDRGAVPYCQPDFRAAAAIDATSIRPLPLALVVRRVGREAETSMSGAEVREIVAALYAMYGVHARADHMAPLWALFERLPDPRARVGLGPPLPC